MSAKYHHHLLVVLVVSLRPVEFPEGGGGEDGVVLPVDQLVPAGQLERQPGDEARGEAVRCETRRVETGVEDLLAGGGGEDGQRGVREVRQGLGGQLVDQDPATGVSVMSARRESERSLGEELRLRLGMVLDHMLGLHVAGRGEGLGDVSRRRLRLS